MIHIIYELKHIIVHRINHCIYHLICECTKYIMSYKCHFCMYIYIYTHVYSTCVILYTCYIMLYICKYYTYVYHTHVCIYIYDHIHIYILLVLSLLVSVSLLYVFKQSSWQRFISQSSSRCVQCLCGFSGSSTSSTGVRN